MSGIAAGPVAADERQADRETLRAMLRTITRAINEQDWDAIYPCLDEDVVVVLMDQVPLRGLAGLREYLAWLFRGANSILTEVFCEPVVDAPAVFHGDAAILTLASHDRFTFRTGRQFTVRSTWSGTMVRKDGAWKLAALHGGVSPFDNPISAPFTRMLKVAVGGAGVAGGMLGWLLGRRRD
jgi:ketosteroid isomerase-like protein